MQDDPPNQYRDLRLHELNEAIGRRVKELLDGEQVGRRDTAYLLISAASAIAPDTAHPNSPAKVVREGSATPLEAYGPVLDQAQRTLRYWLIKQAIDAAGGLPAGPKLDGLLYLAMASDDGCRQALAALGSGVP